MLFLSALCDSNDGSNASEERCKSPTSGRQHQFESYPTKLNHCRNCDLFLKNEIISHVGSTSPGNSDDERKQRFIDMGTFLFRVAFLLKKKSSFYVTSMIWLLSLKSFLVKVKSRRFSRTVANDFGTVYNLHVFLTDFFFLSEWQLLTTLCLLPVPMKQMCFH